MAQTKTPPYPSYCKKGFSLVELIIVIVIIGILSGAAYYGIQRVKTMNMNDKMMDDLIAISNALEQYKKDHFGSFPKPATGGDQNVLCFNADATYAHDCDSASFRQGMIDNNLLSKRYLQEVPVDPRTGSRYVYGVDATGKYFMVAGLYEESDGKWTARTADNLSRGFNLPSLIRAYDGPNFVMNKGPYLPYSPDHLVITARLDNVNGQVEVNGGAKSNTATLYKGDIISATNGTADIYFSDGSVSHLDTGSEVTISEDSEVTENKADSIITRIKLILGKGRIWSKVVRLASASEFSIETTTAIAGVRGTEFIMEAYDNGNPKSVVVISGNVDVLDPDPNLPEESEPLAELSDMQKLGFDEEGKPGEEENVTEEDIPPALFTLNNNIRPYLLSIASDDGNGIIVRIRSMEQWDFTHIIACTGATGVAGGPEPVCDTANYFTKPSSSNGAYEFSTDSSLIGQTVVFAFAKIKDAANGIETRSGYSHPPVGFAEDMNLTEEHLNPEPEQEGAWLYVTGPSEVRLPEVLPGGTSSSLTFSVKAALMAFDASKLPEGMSVQYRISDITTSPCSLSDNTYNTSETGEFSITASSEGVCDFTLSAYLLGSPDGSSGQLMASAAKTITILPASPAGMADFSFQVNGTAIADTSKENPYVLPPSAVLREVTLTAIKEDAKTYQWQISRGSVTPSSSSAPTATLDLGDALTGEPAEYKVTLMVTSEDNVTKVERKSLWVRLPIVTAVTMTGVNSSYTVGETITPTFTVTVDPTTITAPALYDACVWSAAPVGKVEINNTDNTLKAIAATGSDETVTLTCRLKQIIGFQMPFQTNLTATFTINAERECEFGEEESSTDECTPVENGINQKTRTCSQEGQWGEWSDCVITCYTGYIPENGACIEEQQTPILTLTSDQPYYAKGAAVGLSMQNLSPESVTITSVPAGKTGTVTANTFVPNDVATYTLSATGADSLTIKVCGYAGTDGNECWLLGGTQQSCTTVCDMLDDTSMGIDFNCEASDWNVNSAICAGLNVNTFQQLTDPNGLDNSYAPYKMASYCKARHNSPNYIPNGSVALFGCMNTPSGSHARICKCQ
ncbi:FecR domain-containing protein [Candidatus Peregrinibacteria bacterium]|nr:FecR domain-containing protein [Candidatus Peregrinibacteria bacterium]